MGGWLELDVGDIGVTQSATLAGAEEQVRDYLATMLGGEPDEYSVSVAAALGASRRQAPLRARQPPRPLEPRRRLRPSPVGLPGTYVRTGCRSPM